MKPLSLTWITSVLITICSLKTVQFVALITALKCSSLSHVFRCVVEKNKNVIQQPRWVRIGKTVPSVLSTGLGLRPRAITKTSGTVFSITDLPAGE